MEKIDSHVHVGDAGKWDLKLSLQDLEEIRDQNEVTHAVVIPWLHGPQYGPEQNLDLLEQVAGNPAYLFFYWELEKVIADLRFSTKVYFLCKFLDL